MRNVVSCFFLLAVIAHAGAGTFYVSNRGDDQHDGKSEATAWRTAAKVNAGRFSAGDQILFQRGGEWHESLIASSDGDAFNPIIYADYGDPNAMRPIFWGSDVTPASAIKLEHDSIYSFPISAVPNSRVDYVFADHEFLAAATDGRNLKPGSFCVFRENVLINTGGADPRTGAPLLTATDRAQGVSADSGLICSNGHNHLVFRNLIGRETAGVPIAAGVPDGYVFRIQGSSDVRLEKCDAINGGKHHIGVINSTGFMGKNLYARGCIPGLPFGSAGAFVSFSDESRHGDTSEWIDCTVDHFDPGQTAFITHGAGLGKLLIQNLTAIGCNIGIGTDGRGEVVIIKGGLLTGPTCDLYGTGITVDGLHIRGDAKIDVFGNNNLIQNCIDEDSDNEQGGIVVRGKSNVIRSNTLNHDPLHGPCITVKSTAADTQIVGNSFDPKAHAINDEGASNLKVVDQDSAATAPQPK